MRLTINLEDDLYAVAKSLASAEDKSISHAVNILIRRGLVPQGDARKQPKSGLPVVRQDVHVRGRLRDRRRALVTYLLDGNVLVSLLLDGHAHHVPVSKWFT